MTALIIILSFFAATGITLIIIHAVNYFSDKPTKTLSQLSAEFAATVPIPPKPEPEYAKRPLFDTKTVELVTIENRRSLQDFARYQLPSDDLTEMIKGHMITDMLQNMARYRPELFTWEEELGSGYIRVFIKVLPPVTL